ncbi:alpha-L-fucosidase [Enemella evansiae]|uniref:alpha-L-fucosidase n=1 Tax=Enemella evansiae TaxID=2016499 RepID=A0A255GLL0_9ACTN|nr:alpha-L-fucosidase [Enemella evansiae]OYO16728.1 alpha-L-fucosidase [Enemella evansiae]
MLNFEHRTGPVIDPPVRYPDLTVPAWWRDAKLGFFVHWGIYSVPAWAYAGPDRPADNPYHWHRYAEWYANTVRFTDGPTAALHRHRYGTGTSYADLLDDWHAESFDATEFVDRLTRTGGRYLVPVTKHHDGCCLWGTGTTPFNTVRRGPRRDLIDELARAARAHRMRLGLYYSGALDWHVSDFPPIAGDAELFAFRRNDPEFAGYAAGQLRELIERFRPDILWNDIDWPDAGKDHGPDSLATLLTEYRNLVPDGVVNDRWGIPAHGHLTREYSHVPDTLPEPWEATRGIGLSFGLNTDEAPEHTLTGADLVRLLVDVVAKNGNLLLNVGPDATGELPAAQTRVLDELGVWMADNADAIHGTRPWRRFGDADDFRYTQRDGDLFVHLLHPAQGVISLPTDVPHPAHWLGAPGTAAMPAADGLLTVPTVLRDSPVAVAVCPGGAHAG